jgi:hypothetical protein
MLDEKSFAGKSASYDSIHQEYKGFGHPIEPTKQAQK